MNPDFLDPYMIHIGNGGIKWYSFFAFVGYVLAFICVIIYIRKKYHLSASIVEKAAFLLIPISLLGARIWYVIFNTYVIKNWYDVIAFWNGGIAIQGGFFIGCIIGVFIFWKLCDNKKDLLKYADCILPFILLGQALGRWGNFFNMEILGQPTSFESVKNLGAIATYLHYNFDAPGVYRVPLFIIQFFTNIFALVLIVMIIPTFLNVTKYSGFLGALYFIFGGIIRASMELERSEVDIMRDSLGTPVSFVLAIVFIIIGIIVFCFLAMSYYTNGDVSFEWKDNKKIFRNFANKLKTQFQNSLK